MITLKNRSTTPTNLLWDPFFIGQKRVMHKPAPVTTSRINTNILKNDSGFTIQLAVPGFKKDQFSLEVKDEKLVISLNIEKPKAKEANESSTSDVKVLVREFQFGSFKKSFTIPQDIDLDQIKATYEAGILNVDLVKKPVFVKTVEIH